MLKRASEIAMPYLEISGTPANTKRVEKGEGFESYHGREFSF